MRKVAITGGLSSGKSSVCELLKQQGAYVVSADEIVHGLLTFPSKIGLRIVKLLGEEVVNGNQFDRAKIAQKVFGNEKLLKQFEALLHPAVFEEIERQYNEVSSKKIYTLFVAEVPLLYESESAHLFNTVVVVMTDPEIARMRFKHKTASSSQAFEKRMSHQISPEEKAAKADFVIFNNAGLDALKAQVEILYQNLIQPK